MEDEDVNYEGFRQQLLDEFHVDVTVDQLKDLDYVTKLIGKYGYAVAFRTTTEQVYTELRAQYGNSPEPEMLENIRENVCFYTYQLYGRQYKSWGAHPCPLTPNLQMCVLTALYNVLRHLPEETKN